MKFNDLKIGIRLALGLGCILAFVILLGIVAYIQEESVWQETKGMYEHPLQVRRAIDEIGVDVLSMHRDMKDMILSDNETERENISQDIDTYEAGALFEFNVLYDRYLGSKSDIDTLYADFVKWRTTRERTIELLNEGNIEEAIARVKPNGTGGADVTRIMNDLSVISDFALKRGDQFYQDAEQHKNDLILNLILLTMIILLLSLLISYYLLIGIRNPVKELTAVSARYQMGDFDARSRYVSKNEFGELSTSYNTLVETIQKEMKSKENAARISEVMLTEEELLPFCHELLKTLLQYTNSQVGAIYLLNTEKTEYSLLDSIGLCSSCRASFSASNLEGEFGTALATRQIQQIKDISEDTPFVLSTVSGDIRPREIVTIPIPGGKDIIALISLASVDNYSEESIRLIHDISDILTARFNGVIAFSKNQEISKSLESQNCELMAQSRELFSHTNELKEQNIELEVQKKQLDEANRLKSVFLSNMSHELRTPLNSVIALSGVLIRHLQGKIPDDEYSYLEVIERNGRLLLSLINDILDIARIEAGKEEVQISSFSVRGLVSTVLDMIEPQAIEKGIALINNIDDTTPTITSDLSKCQHILQNLVANAVKFTEKGSVTISVTTNDNGIFISVSDTGIGIKAEILPYIFDEFRQGDERIGRMYGGSGLGLSIAKKYALFLNGNILVESTQGSGSTFTLRLPFRFSDESPYPIKESKGKIQQISDDGTNETRDGPGTILLVEDNEPAIIQIRDLLEEQGYYVWVARDGKEALARIQIALPDALILDLMMPEVDGFTVLHMIRSQERTANLPVLILTAKHITNEELAFLKGNHVHQLIQKGDISRSSLVAAVKNMILTPAAVTKTVPEPLFIRESHARPRILIIEDNPDNLITVRAILQDMADIIEATDGQTGLAQARKQTPDIILLDISLPVMDGFQVLDALKSDENLHKIPVVALTARAMLGDREEILSQGFDGYLSKPVDEGLLKQTIRRILNE